MFAGISSDGSSESDSGASAGAAGGVPGVGAARAGAGFVSEMGTVLRGAVAGCSSCFCVTSASALGFGSGAGVSSTVVCFPVVQGGMLRNSSKSRTRGLQHFQPS